MRHCEYFAQLRKIYLHVIKKFCILKMYLVCLFHVGWESYVLLSNPLKFWGLRLENVLLSNEYKILLLNCQSITIPTLQVLVKA